jgi:ATP-dependent helicase/nuclease subunit A
VNAPLSARAQAELAQHAASDPLVSAWVGASAGSGKTKVLTDRVLRLLLQDGQAANRILCLTFTKAAAAEMQTRLARRLGAWACADDGLLDAHLQALGCEPGETLRRRARGLFAEVLELPGGMRISTIHAFCQSLLRAFPLEAGLPPQFAVLEDAEAASLLADAREAVLTAGLAPTENLQSLAGLVSADDFSGVLSGLMRERERIAACINGCNGVSGLRLRLARAIGLPDGEEDAASAVAALCRVPDEVARAAAALVNQKNKKPQALGNGIRAWLALDGEERAARWQEWHRLFFTGEGKVRAEVAADAVMAAEAERLAEVQGRLAGCRLLAATEALLALAHPVLGHFDARKRGAGLMAYDDLIATAERVLRDPGSAWVLFKLDGGLDHVLLDEAQDSNPAQWRIAAALTEEFFAGQGAERRTFSEAEAEAARRRSVFAVGDIKQSIYGFQGADTAGFGTWGTAFERRVRDSEGEFRQVPLTTSFRSTAPVLALVDAVFAEDAARRGVVPDGAEALLHRADREGHAGAVELWPLLRRAAKPKPLPWLVPEQPEQVADAPTLLAEAVAARIAHMLRHDRLHARCVRRRCPRTGAETLEARPVRPGDVLVLVRRRTAFVQRLVRALKERGVPVGGVDRLALVEQIAVQDLLALCDALLLPEDDLQLAALLKSPLIGLSEEALFGLAHGRAGSLWAALSARRGSDTPEGRAAEWIACLQGRADLVTPHALLAEVLGEPSLGGPDRPAASGRARLLARLGPDAADPLDEVLNAALAYERAHPPSLQGFVHWLRRGGAQVKREAESGADAVRIMTVHGAKGLEAPVVVLPDLGAGNPPQVVRWTTAEGGVELPLWAPRARQDHQPPAYAKVKEEDDRRRQEEENRLLYVALTRAEDRLLVCGMGEPDPESWHGKVAAGFRRLAGRGAAQSAFDHLSFGAPAACDFGGEHAWRHECPQRLEPVEDRAAAEAAAQDAAALPDWATRPAPPESAETIIAPSALPGEQETPAASPHGRADPYGRRFRRGRLVHALLQHLPERDPAERVEAGRRFLGRPGHGLSDEEQAELLREVLDIVEAPALAAAFGPGSLAEAPIVGRVGGQLISGQVDRLVVAPDRVLVLDYKTNRPPPETPDEVAPLHLRQMAAYRAVLRAAFPGREVECVLVWTYGASRMVLPPRLLDAHAPPGA